MSEVGGAPVKLTKRAVDAATPGAKLRRIWDSELKGFGLRVTPSGSKSYFVYYRPGGGRSAPQREYTIGRHGPLTPDQARSEAERLLGSVRLGQDPQAQRQDARKDTLTVDELCDEYLEDGVTTKKPRTIRSDRSRIRAHIKPLLGKKRVKAVTSEDISKFLADVARGETSRIERLGPRATSVIRGGKGAATRTVGLLGGIFSYAIDRKYRPDNPVEGVKRFKDRQSQRYLTDKELERLGVALEHRAAEGSNGKALQIIRLLVFTGCRRDEIETLRWSEVDLQRAQLRLGDSKTGAKVVPLGAPAAAILGGIKPTKGNPFVFPAERRKGAHYSGAARVWRQARQDAGLEDVRAHDLRHTYASLAIADGQSLEVIGKILGHRDVKTTRQYAHLADDPLKRAAQRASARAQEAMGGTKSDEGMSNG